MLPESGSRVRGPLHRYLSLLNIQRSAVCQSCDKNSSRPSPEIICAPILCASSKRRNVCPHLHAGIIPSIERPNVAETVYDVMHSGLRLVLWLDTTCVWPGAYSQDRVWSKSSCSPKVFGNQSNIPLHVI